MHARNILFAIALAAPAARAEEGETGPLARVRHALAIRRYDAALTIASRAPKSAWLDYERGVALGELGRTDESVRAFQAAEAELADPRHKSLAIYGRARALDSAGRCTDAYVVYQQYASLARKYALPVTATDRSGTEPVLSVASQCTQHVDGHPELTVIASALMRGDFVAVLELAGLATPSTESKPWLDYDRGSAFTGLAETDEAVTAFRAAEVGFQGLGDSGRWGQSLAIWGRARALRDVGRCTEANHAFDEYGTLIASSDRAGAQMAGDYVRSCTPRSVERSAPAKH
jgi:tetratricopeptide (TPR) repeat protein